MPAAAVNDIEIAYDLVGSGPPLVLIHGAQSDRSVFGSLLPVLEPRFRVLLFDQRGIGGSSKPDAVMSIALLADDTAALMETVGLPRAHIFGVSMGGMIAQELALRHPGRVDRLILGCSTPGGPHRLNFADENAQAAYSTESLSAEERARALAETIFTPAFLDTHPEVLEGLMRSRADHPLEPTAFAHRLRAAEGHDTHDRLGEIAAPTLVITGENDAIIPSDHSRVLARGIPGARLVVLEPAGHGFWIEQREASVDAIVDSSREPARRRHRAARAGGRFWNGRAKNLSSPTPRPSWSWMSRIFAPIRMGRTCGNTPAAIRRATPSFSPNSPRPWRTSARCRPPVALQGSR